MTKPAERPAYMSRATLATYLDISESTVDEMVRRSVLPSPIKLSPGCVRFCWAEVEMALQARKNGAVEVDKYTAGARNVKAAEGRNRVP